MVLFVSLLSMVVFAIYLGAISGIKLSEIWSVWSDFRSLNDIVKIQWMDNEHGLHDGPVFTIDRSSKSQHRC